MDTPQDPSALIIQIQSLLQQANPPLREIRKLSLELAKSDPNFQNFAIDAKTLIHLGRDSIKDHTTALLELVKNSYDADAFNVEVDVFCKDDRDLIRVSDNGFGMTKDQLINYWLRIGFSSKRKSKVSELGRRKTGEKGIGRISTDRLGANLELVTKTKDSELVGLRVNWNDFDTEGKDVSDIEVEIFTPTIISLPKKENAESKSGTEIKINNLRQPWSKGNIENLYYELSALTSPFRKVKDFVINLQNDVAPEFSKPVDSDFYKASEIEVTAVFDGSDEVYYSIKDKYNSDEKVATINLQQFYSKAQYENSDSGLTCGPVEVKLLFFLRDSSAVTGTELKLSDLREFLDNNNGVKIYRDHIAVKPYGFPKAQLGYDWLGLGDRKAKDPAGVSRSKDYTVSPYQLVGAVFITRDSNLELLDSAAREGLVESEAFFDMKEFVMATLRLLESHRAEIYPQIESNRKEKAATPTHKEVEKLMSKLSSVKDDLNTIKSNIESEDEKVKIADLLSPISKTITKVDVISDDVDSTISELLKWQRVLSGLATMGISSAVFGHETEGSITQFQGSTKTAIKLINVVPPEIQKSLIELEKALKHSKRVAAWGSYALTRVQREKRNKRNVQIYKTIDSVVKELKPAFEASAIEIKLKGENLYSKTYQMDIESILVNLLTNSYTACLLNKRVRKVEIDVNLEEREGKKGFYFSVSDTGPGVAKEFKNRIFEPLFSTKNQGANESKSVGTGLGLTIVKSIVDELMGEITLETDEVLKGASFKIWLPKE